MSNAPIFFSAPPFDAAARSASAAARRLAPDMLLRTRRSILKSLPTAMRWVRAVARIALVASACCAAPIAAAETLDARATEVEAYLQAYPKRAVAELAALAREADVASPRERRFVYGLQGQALVAAGRNRDAVGLAERMETESAGRADPLWLATAKLVRGSVESQSGDHGKANALAKEARALANGATDPNIGYWSAMMIGITARGRGQMEESLANLQDAFSAAEKAGNAFRRAYALYQISQLHLAMKQPQRALVSSRQS